MVRFFVQYSFWQIAGWFLFLPLGSLLLLFPLSLITDLKSALFLQYLMSNVVITLIFTGFTLAYQYMLNVMPLPATVIVQAKFRFCTLIIAYQLVLFTIIHALFFPSDSLLIALTVACFLSFLVLNITLFFHFYFGQQKDVFHFLFIFMILGSTLLSVDRLLTPKLSLLGVALLFVFMSSVTWGNQRLCVRFVRTKDFY